MKNLTTLILLLLFGFQPLYAAENAADVIHIQHAFARASIPGMSMSAIFMTLSNSGQTEHLLVDAKSDIADSVELHGHVMQDGMMQMRHMAHYHLKPGKNKILQPGGLHIMLIGLKHKLVEGQTFKVTLIFEDGSKLSLPIPVKSISASQ